MADTRWKDIILKLKEKSIESYGPASKFGDCLAPYVVVKDDGSAPYAGLSSVVTYYSVMCYVPKDKYSTLETYVEQVKAAMAELKPMVMPTGQETPSFYDDSFKAHMQSLQYRVNKKVNF